MYQVRRFSENPIIYPELHNSVGDNINGPSLIRLPDWIRAPLGRYYLYFAHHRGTFIRLAYADDLHGPWRIHVPGTLQLNQTCCVEHIASPDLHIDETRQEIVLYFHGKTALSKGPQSQRSFRAVSKDGLHFESSDTVLGPYYFRVFQHKNDTFAVAKSIEKGGGGVLLHSPDGRTPFIQGPEVLPLQRHSAVLKKSENEIQVLFSRIGDCPERILVSEMSLDGDWKRWSPRDPVDLLRPEAKYEGVDLPLKPSSIGAVFEPCNQVRDPCVFQEDNRIYLLYSCAGESALAISELVSETR